MKEEDLDHISKLRDAHTVPFQPSDFDMDALIATLRKKRKIDNLLLSFIQLREEGVTSLTATEAANAFNSLAKSDFYLQVNGDLLRLRPEIRRLLDLAHEAHAKKQPVDPAILQTLNRALIHAVYPSETIKSRQYERYIVPEMVKMAVSLSPLSPAQGETHEGKLLNVSMGGMALLLPKRLPDMTYWALRISIANQSEIETVVQIRHSMPQKDMFVHGIQFVDIPSYLGTQVENFSRDFFSCEDRLKAATKAADAVKAAAEICRLDCGLFTYCTKPQKRKAA